MTQIRSKEIRMVSIDEIKLNPKNRNKHSKDQIARLAQIIEYQGFRQPLMVSNQSGLLVAGHGRYAAAKKLKLKEVPVIFQDFDSMEQEIAAGVSDNSIALWAELDLEGIKTDLADLGPEFNIDLLGIQNFSIDAADKEGLTDPDDTPETPKESPVCRGELFRLGNHRLLCGDSTSITDVERLMNGDKADMVFTDPPYNTGMSPKKQGDSTRLSHMFNDSFTEEAWQNLLSSFCSNYWISMKDDSVAYVCLDWRRNHELVPHLKSHFKLSNIIVWDKMVHGLGSDYKYTYELINVCKKGNPNLDTHQGDREYSDVWHIQRVMGRDEEHATKKPIELVQRAIRHSSKERNLVLDLFLGSGSTLIACEKANRQCYGMEIDPHYCSVILDRWAAFTGKDPVRLNDDGTETSWSEMKATLKPSILA